MLKKLFSHTLIYGLSNQVPKIASLFTLPIITKYLSDIDFGVYGLITAITAGLSILANLGLNITLTNSFYKSRFQYKWAWRQIYGMLMIWSIPYSFLVGLVLYLFIPEEAYSDSIMIIVLNVLPIVFFGPTMLLGTLYFQLRQKPVQVAIRTGSIGLMTVVLNLLFIAYLDMGYMGWFWSLAISQIFLQTSYWYPINIKAKLTPIFNFKWRYIRRQLSITLPTVPHFYGAYLLNASDRVIMNVVGVQTGNIGRYNAANSVSGIFNQLSGASAQAISPLLFSSYRMSNDKQVRRLIFNLSVVFLCGTSIASIWMKEIFVLLIKNETLQKVYPTAIILSMAYCSKPMYYGANNRLFYYEKTKVLLKVTLVAGIANVLLNLLLIPMFGWQVAAYTSFICLMYMGYVGYFLKEFKVTNSVKFYPLIWLLVTIVMTVSVYIMVEWNYILKIAISIMILLVTLVCLRRFSRAADLE